MRSAPPASHFAQPFLSPERWVFWQPWLVIIGSAWITVLATRHAGVGLAPWTTTLAFGHLLTQRWYASLPAFFAWLACHQVAPEQRAAFAATVAQHEPRKALGWRLALTGPGLIYVTTFAFHWYGNNMRGLGFSVCFGVWVWMSATIGVVTIQFARCLRALADRDLLQITPEHPDRCGGLARVGASLAFMVSPLVVGSLVLGLFAFNPYLSPPFWTWARGTLCYQDQDCAWLQQEALSGRQRTARGRLLKRRLERLEQQCADPEIDDAAFERCVASAVKLDHDRELLERGRKMLDSQVVPYARVGLFIVVAALLILLSPVWRLHQAMIRQRDAVLQRDTALIVEIEGRLRHEVLSDTKHLPEERLLAFSSVRQTLVGRRFPLWPFDVPTLIRTVGPPLLAIATTLLRDIGLW